MSEPATHGTLTARPPGRRQGFHNTVALLLLIGAILGGTIFDAAQIGCELAAILLLLYGVFRVRLTNTDVILLLALTGVSVASFFVNEFRTFALNFKLFLLCILTYVYFTKVRFCPTRLITVIFWLNAAMIVHQYVTGQSVVPTSWFGFYRGYASDRPVGLFLTPHASSFFLAICVVFYLSAKPLKALFSFLLALLTMSLTNIVSAGAQVVNDVLRRYRAYRSTFGRVPFFTFVVLPLALIWLLLDPIFDLLRVSSYTRYYSAEILLPQFFDWRYFAEGLRVIPANYEDVLLRQGITWAVAANEIGYVKLLIEGGLILGGLTLIALVRELKSFRVLIYVSLLHYSFLINFPFFLLVMIGLDRKLQSRGPAGNVNGRRYQATRRETGSLVNPATESPEMQPVA